MRSMIWLFCKATLSRARDRARAVRLSEASGFVILIFAAWLYLGAYMGDGAACVVSLGKELLADGRFNLQCLHSVMDDLREDGTAATVILAIAAAILAKAWSRGATPEE